MDAQEREEIRVKARAHEALLDTLRAHTTGTMYSGWTTLSHCSCGWQSKDPLSEGGMAMHIDVRNEHLLEKLAEAGYTIVKGN